MINEERIAFAGYRSFFPFEIDQALEGVGEVFEFCGLKPVLWMQTLKLAYDLMNKVVSDEPVNALHFAITEHEIGKDSHPENAKFRQTIQKLKDCPYPAERPVERVEVKESYLKFFVNNVPVFLHFVENSSYLEKPDVFNFTHIFQPFWLPNPVHLFMQEEFEKTLLKKGTKNG